MNDPRRDRPSASNLRRTCAIVLSSIALHVVVLGALGLQRPPELKPRDVTESPGPIIQLDLVGRHAPRPTTHVQRTESALHGRRATSSNFPNSPRVPSPGAEVSSHPAPSAVASPAPGEKRLPTFRSGAGGCAYRTLLSEAERAVCDARFAERAGASPAIAGSGDPRRDARFADQGARALARYEDRRAVGPAQRMPCDKTGPIADCGVEIRVELFSSRDGFLPGLRRDD